MILVMNRIALPWFPQIRFSVYGEVFDRVYHATTPQKRTKKKVPVRTPFLP